MEDAFYFWTFYKCPFPFSLQRIFLDKLKKGFLLGDTAKCQKNHSNYGCIRFSRDFIRGTLGKIFPPYWEERRKFLPEISVNYNIITLNGVYNNENKYCKNIFTAIYFGGNSEEMEEIISLHYLRRWRIFFPKKKLKFMNVNNVTI